MYYRLAKSIFKLQVTHDSHTPGKILLNIYKNTNVYIITTIKTNRVSLRTSVTSSNSFCSFTLRQLGLTKEKSFPEFRSFLRLRADVLLSDRVDVELGEMTNFFRHTGYDGNCERCADDRHK